MKEFDTAKMDSQTRIFTFIFVAVCILVPFFMIYLATQDEMPIAAAIFPSIVVLTALISSFLMIPKISTGNGKIFIINSFVNIAIPSSEIVGVKKYERVGANIRTFGVGGLFGYFGYFNGNDIWYVTNIRKKVKIQTAKKLYIISPENPDDFIEEINRMRTMDK